MSGQMNTQDEFIDLCNSKAAFTVGTDLRATGTATMDKAPEYAELLKVCGFRLPASPVADTFELVNDTDGVPHGSAIVFVDDNEFKFTDTLVGALTANFEIGKPANIAVDLSGYIDSEIPVNTPNPVPVLNTEKALIVSCLDIVTVGGTVIPAEKVVIKTNPQIAETYTMGGTNGKKDNTITDYSLTLDISFPVDKTKYAEAAMAIRSGTVSALRVIIGADSAGKPVDGESVLITADLAKATAYTDSDKNGLLDRTLSFRLFNGNRSPAMRWLTGKIAGL